MSQVIRIIIIVIAALTFLAVVAQAQNCITGAWGDMRALHSAIEGEDVSYSINLCASIPSAPRPKRIKFEVSYDTDGDNITDTTLEYYHDAANASQLPAGNYCLSDISDEFVITLPPMALVEIQIIGYTSNSVNGEASDCITYGFSTEATDIPINLQLPVELADFRGDLDNNQAILGWSTFSESNSAHFEVERSCKDMQSFETIGEVSAEGESTEEIPYRFVDENPCAANYYRLRMVDLDGTYEYSPIVFLEGKLRDALELRVSPNPIRSNGTLQVLAPMDMEANMVISSNFGQVLDTRAVEFRQGGNAIPLDLANYPSGTYNITVIDGESVITERIVIQ